MKNRIVGKIVYQNLGMGFWGILGDDGQEWLPINMPEQLKTPGARVEVTARKIEDYVSMHMWGQAIRITAFQTLMP
ncbi:MAG: hypothetical protein AAF985_25580 [Bacteroidota bacterium]